MKRRGVILLEVAVAISIFALGMVTLSSVLVMQLKFARGISEDTAVCQVLEHELLRLEAGAWRAYPEGTSQLKPERLSETDRGDYSVRIEPDPANPSLLMLTVFYEITGRKAASLVSFIRKGADDE